MSTNRVSGAVHILPKPDGGCPGPEFFGLDRVVLQKLLVVNDKKGVSGNILWEGRQVHGDCGM